MNCPNCQTPMLEKIQVCKSCEIKYTNADIVEMLQLKFLLAESAKWPNFEEQRTVYVQRWKELEQHLKVKPQPVKEMTDTNLPPAAINAADTLPVSKQDSSGHWLFSETTNCSWYRIWNAFAKLCNC